MTLITLYDVGAYVAMLTGMLAHGALPALLAVDDGQSGVAVSHLSRLDCKVGPSRAAHCG